MQTTAKRTMPDELLVAVTGGSGFIAGRFITHVLEHGVPGCRASVRALVSSESARLRVSAVHPGLEAGLMPAGDDAALRDGLSGAQVLLHAGWSTVPATADLDPIGDLRANVEGSLRLFRAAIASGVRRIVFISSGGTVYGEAGRLPITEEQPVRPTGAYGASKLCVERYLAAMAGHAGIEHLILRPSNVYGRARAHDQPQGVIEHWMQAALAGQEGTTWSDLAVERDYLHIDDMVRALLLAIAAPIAHPVLNVGTGRGTTLGELATLIGAISGRPFHVAAPALPKAAIRRNVLDAGLIGSCWGWRTRVSLEEGLQRMFEVLNSPPGAA